MACGDITDLDVIYISYICVLELIVCEDMSFYVCSTRAAVCHAIFCTPVATHGHSTSKVQVQAKLGRLAQPN